MNLHPHYIRLYFHPVRDQTPSLTLTGLYSEKNKRTGKSSNTIISSYLICYILQLENVLSSIFRVV